MDKVQILKNIRLGKYFSAIEFANTKDGHAIILPDSTLVKKLDDLREIVGSIRITSGYRTPTFNKSVGGSSNSYHLQGLAVDCVFNFSDFNKASLTKIFKAIGFTNVNFYWNRDKSLNRIHLDIGKTWNGQEFNYRDIQL